MKSIILIKYGELTTKGDNRKQFIEVLSKNINEKLKINTRECPSIGHSCFVPAI